MDTITIFAMGIGCCWRLYFVGPDYLEVILDTDMLIVQWFARTIPPFAVNPHEIVSTITFTYISLS